MDHVANRLQNAYHVLLKAVSDVLEAKESADSNRTIRTDAALEQFYSAFQLFQATCDQAQEFLEERGLLLAWSLWLGVYEFEIITTKKQHDSVKQRIGSECIVDEATGPIFQKLTKISEEGTNKSAIPPLSATRLEQLSKVVRMMVVELQLGANTGISPPAVDNRPSDD